MRVCAKSSSTTDLILVSDTDNVSHPDVIDIGISDHCLIFCNLYKKNNKHNTVRIRSMIAYSK